jgi:hypothetical protein
VQLETKASVAHRALVRRLGHRVGKVLREILDFKDFVVHPVLVRRLGHKVAVGFKGFRGLTA